MSHDPCNPLPSFAIPAGLPLRTRQMAMPGPSHLKPSSLQSHVITGMAPSYIGCDHKQADHVRIKSVQMPAPVNLPAAFVPRASAIAVATLPSAYPTISSFASLPESEIQLPMPEPSSAILFLFAVFVAWSARRLDLLEFKLPALFTLSVAPPAKCRHHHRSKSIACYHAFQQPAS